MVMNNHGESFDTYRWMMFFFVFPFGYGLTPMGPIFDEMQNFDPVTTMW